MPSLGSPLPPEVPNPRDAADNEIGFVREGLNLGKEYGRVDQTNPFGTQRWDGQKLITEYDPRITADYYAGLGARQGLRDDLSEGFNPTDLPALTGSVDPGQYRGDYDRSGFTDIERGALSEASDATRQRTEDALYNRGATRLDRRFGQQRSALEESLRNKGFAGGGGAGGENGYDEAMGNFSQAENDAYSSLINDSIKFGGEEQSRLLADEMRRQKTMFDQTKELRGIEGAEAQQGWVNDNTSQQLSFADRLASGKFGNEARGSEFERQAKQWMMPFQASTALGQTPMPSFGTPTTALQNPVSASYRQFTEDDRAQESRRANFSKDILNQAMDPNTEIGRMVQQAGGMATALGKQIVAWAQQQFGGGGVNGMPGNPIRDDEGNLMPDPNGQIPNGPPAVDDEGYPMPPVDEYPIISGDEGE